MPTTDERVGIGKLRTEGDLLRFIADKLQIDPSQVRGLSAYLARIGTGGGGGPETDPLSVHTGAAAGGDLGGTYPNPTVTGLAGKAPLSHTHPESDITGLVSDLAAKQPLDSDLTAIAALATTSFGRAFLTLADAAASRAYIDAAQTSHTHAESDITGLVSDLAGKQPLDSDLTAIAALATTAFGRSFLTLVDAAAARTLIDSPSNSDPRLSDTRTPNVPITIASGTTYTVPANTQVLYDEWIVADGDMVIDGDLIDTGYDYRQIRLTPPANTQALLVDASASQGGAIRAINVNGFGSLFSIFTGPGAAGENPTFGFVGNAGLMAWGAGGFSAVDCLLQRQAANSMLFNNTRLAGNEGTAQNDFITLSQGFVPSLLSSGQSYTVPANKQACYAGTITALGDMTVDGDLYDVADTGVW